MLNYIQSIFIKKNNPSIDAVRLSDPQTSTELSKYSWKHLPQILEGFVSVGLIVVKKQYLYQAVIERAKYAYELALKLNISEDERNSIAATNINQFFIHEEEAVRQFFIQGAYLREEIPRAFKILNDAGVIAFEYEDVYQNVMKRASAIVSFTQIFKVLDEVGITIANHQDIYQSVIDNVHVAIILAPMFNILKDAGAGVEHKALFQSAIRHSHTTDSLAQVFQKLMEAGATVIEHEDLYQEAIKQSKHASKLARALSVLESIGGTVDKCKPLFFRTIQSAFFADQLAIAYESINSAGGMLLKHQDLYRQVSGRPHDANRIAAVFDSLIDNGIRITDHEDLYKEVITYSYYLGRLNQAFEIIKDTGIKLAEYVNVCRAMITNSKKSAKYAITFRTLHEIGIMAADQEFYQRLINNPWKQIDKITQIIKALHDSEINVVQYKEISQSLLNGTIEELDLLFLTFRQLRQAGFVRENYVYLYQLFLERILNSEHSIYTTMKLLNRLCGYAGEKNRVMEEPELRHIISETTRSEVSYGPLNKTECTYAFEALLQRIAAVQDLKDIQMSFKAEVGYLISLYEEEPIDITLLLRYANLSHLTLSDEVIKRFGEIISKLSNEKITEESPGNARDALSKLPEASRKAINYYTGYYYKNINRLFRGERLSEKARYVWLIPVEGSDNLLFNFLCGCLINDAANKLPVLQWEVVEKKLIEKVISVYKQQNPQVDIQVFFTDKNKYSYLIEKSRQEGILNEEEYQLLQTCFDDLSSLHPNFLRSLDRGERVSDELKKRRLANPLILPSITSFSLFREGSRYFHGKNTVRTKLTGEYANYPVINSGEGEIIIPHGEQVQYTHNSEGGFFARILRTPDYERADNYWSSLALKHAYINYLSKCYEDEPHSIIVQEKEIQRPNHGLAHTFRVMENIPPVINYFSQHAKENGFREFCQNISQEEREWLRVAAAFSITGRESEISAGEDIQRYDDFRKASQKHLEKFLELCPLKKTYDPAMKERILHIVCYMGNPAYEKEDQGKGPINDHKNESERAHRNYLHRLLSIAHKLDLPRCYGAAQFEQAMALCRELSEKSPEQETEYQHLIRYNIELIKAHGNALNTDIAADGKLFDNRLSYKSPFDEASSSLKRLFEISETIPRPVIAREIRHSCFAV